MPGPKAHQLGHTLATQRSGGGAGGSGGLVAHAAQVAFVTALNEILLIGAIVAFAGAIGGLLLVRSEDFAHGGEAGEAAPAAA
jgi:hypothetical protein